MGDIEANLPASAPPQHPPPSSSPSSSSSSVPFHRIYVLPNDAAKKILGPKAGLTLLSDAAAAAAAKSKCIQTVVLNTSTNLPQTDRKSAIKIINAPKIQSHSPRIENQSSEEEIKFGMDRKSKARMLHSAKSKALQLESKQAGKTTPSLMMPLKCDEDLEKLIMSKKESKLFDRLHKTKENEFGAIEIVTIEDSSTSSIKKEVESHVDPEMIDLVCREESLQESPTSVKDSYSPPPSKKARKDEILYCDGCGCYGHSGDFLNSKVCSKDCESRLEAKKCKLDKKGQTQRLRRETSKSRREDGPKSNANSSHISISSSSCASLVSDGSETRESSRATTPANIERKQIPPHLEYPWFHPKTRDFCWNIYLDCTSSKGAPTKLFRHALSSPPPKNWFTVGMKLEAVDPEHPSLICVVSVAEVKGYRLRLHFDGFPDSYDFWECGDSPNIFPLGWSGKKRLTPPKGYENKFDWKKYLIETKAVSAPEKIFINKAALQKNHSNEDLKEWKVGAKLEAVDRQNTSMVCVATVAEILAGRILIHFDGWETDYDYWVNPDSPYVHYKGWCDEHNMELNPPNDFPEDEEFDWEVYLKETKSSTVPKSAFKCRQENSSFKKHMKLEVVDKRNPSLIRVATIVKINGRQIKIHLDGWPNEYDFWAEDDSYDIFPPEWCQKVNGTSIENPLTSDEVKFYTKVGKCPTPGCRGVGHIKGPIFPEHSSLSSCPYSPQNLDLDENYLPDRFKITETAKPDEPRVIDKSNDLAQNKEIRQSVFDPPLLPEDNSPSPIDFERNSSFLTEKIVGLPDVRIWSPLDVARFITTLPGLEGSRYIAETILEEEIDGWSFTLLQQSDLVKILGFKLGPAIKIFHSIQILKARIEPSATAE